MQSEQKISPLDIVREKTEKLKSSLENFRLMFKGYSKIRSRVLPRGVSMLMANNNQDEDDEGPFKHGIIKGGPNRFERRISCPGDDVLAEINAMRTEEYDEFTSLPPMVLHYEQPDPDDIYDETSVMSKKKETRSNSLFEFLGKKEKLQEHRHSLPGTTDEVPSSKTKPFKFIQNADKRHTKRLPKGTFTSNTTGAILPSVLLTYQPPTACNQLNENDYYLQTNQMMAIQA